jgi:tRNA 2-thiouridine synthesizing protein C
MSDMDEMDEGSGIVKKFMFLNRKAPHGTVYALITAAFDQDVSMVFTDDGVFQLMKGIDTKGIEVKDFSKTYRALEGYDIEKLYVDQASMDARGLTEDDLIVDVTVLSVDEMANLMAEQDVVISF